MHGDEGRVSSLCLVEPIDEVETWGQERQDGALRRRVPTRQRVRHGIGLARLVLDGEVEPEKLPHPVMLRDHREPLIEQELEAVVISLDDEAAPP